MSVFQQGQPVQIEDSFSLDGIPTNPTAVVYTILKPDGDIDTFAWPGAPQVTNLSAGSFLLSLPPPDLAGLYQYDVDATGAVVASRSDSFFVLPNRTVVAEGGPCSSWVSSQDVWDCCGRPTVVVGEGSMATECPVDMSQYAYEASQLLYQLSGRLFAGICEKTVRPCSERGCGFQVLSRGHIVEDPYSPYPWGWSGGRWRSWHNDDLCSCVPLDRILLSGYPIKQVLEVKIDGVVVPETNNWRLDEKRYLTRIADANGNVQVWPSCQRLDLPDTEPGTFSVTYLYGAAPPLIGIHAAAQLGCEIYKSCVGQECSLPAGTVRVTRQGVTIARLSFQRDQKTGVWATGMNLVDAFLATFNPSGLNRRPSLSGPFGRRYARPIG